jgi:hypothetical protein
MTTLTLKLSKALDEQLTTVAEWLGTSKAAVVQVALQEYLLRQRQQMSPLTVADVAGHLIGCIDVDGPTDLSTNKKYFEGFGENADVIRRLSLVKR